MVLVTAESTSTNISQKRPTHDTHSAVFRVALIIVAGNIDPYGADITRPTSFYKFFLRVATKLKQLHHGQSKYTIYIYPLDQRATSHGFLTASIFILANVPRPWRPVYEFELVSADVFCARIISTAGSLLIIVTRVMLRASCLKNSSYLTG